MLNIINDIVWSPAIILLLIGTGLYLSVRTRFLQIRYFRQMVRLLFRHEKRENQDAISSFQGFCLALSGRIGCGNIVGVATAIALGGPGAVFWMWVTAFLGSATAFAESTMAQACKFSFRGKFYGGPSCYMAQVLGKKWMGVLFSILILSGYGMLQMTVQANSVATAFENSFSIPTYVTGIGLAFILCIITFGGLKRLAVTATIVTPFMSIAYILLAILVMAMHYERIPEVFRLIMDGAMGVNSFASGLLGSTIAMGVKRGLFSNEAGQGGGAIVSGSTDVEHPVQQGLVQAFSVYIDTLLVCTATALMILCSDSYNVFDASGNIVYAGCAELGRNYVSFTQHAIDGIFPGIGNIFLSVALFFFVFTTIMAYYFYASSAIIWLLSQMGEKYLKHHTTYILIYQIVSLSLVILGAITTSENAWTLGDIGVGMATWINVIALLLLSPKVLAILREYEQGRKKGK